MAAAQRRPARRSRRGGDGPVDDVLRPLRHELRNTLTPIAMLADVLALRAPGPEVDILVRDVRRLSLVLDDLFELTRGLPTRLPLAPRTLDLGAVVASIVEATAEHRRQLGVALAVTIPAGLCVTADPTLLAVALASIIRHAATPSAQLALAARRAAGSIQLTLRTDPLPLPDERALDFARRLLELQGGRWVAGDELRVSLRAPHPECAR